MNLFVAAYARTGTTFLAKVLVEKLGFYSSPESHFLFQIYRKIKDNGAITNDDLHTLLSRHFKFQVWDIAPNLPEVLSRDKFVAFYQELLACYNKVSIEQVAANVTLDHTPENMINQPFIQYFFPDSLTLRLIRDPRAVFASAKKVKWGPNTALSFLEEWERTEKSWLDRPTATQYIEIVYEQFIVEPQPFLDEITNKVGEYRGSKDPRFNLPSYTSKQHQLVSSGKGDTSRIDAWKTSLSAREIEILEGSDVLRRYLEMYHYDCLTDGVQATRLERIMDRPVNKLNKAINRLKRKVDGDGY
jgi:hypothetical protein